MTRWQGTTMEMGLRPLAAPTARLARGSSELLCELAVASVWPKGMARRASQTFFWERCCRISSERLKPLRLPAKYS